MQPSLLQAEQARIRPSVLQPRSTAFDERDEQPSSKRVRVQAFPWSCTVLTCPLLQNPPHRRQNTAFKRKKKKKPNPNPEPPPANPGGASPSSSLPSGRGTDLQPWSPKSEPALVPLRGKGTARPRGGLGVGETRREGRGTQGEDEG